MDRGEGGYPADDVFVVWGRKLLEDPVKAITDVITHRGARGAQQRAEAEDFLSDMITHPAWRARSGELLEALARGAAQLVPEGRLDIYGDDVRKVRDHVPGRVQRVLERREAEG